MSPRKRCRERTVTKLEADSFFTDGDLSLLQIPSKPGSFFVGIDTGPSDDGEQNRVTLCKIGSTNWFCVCMHFNVSSSYLRFFVNKKWVSKTDYFLLYKGSSLVLGTRYVSNVFFNNTRSVFVGVGLKNGWSQKPEARKATRKWRLSARDVSTTGSWS